MAEFIVNFGGDTVDATDGVLSLREAILAAAQTPEADVIRFAETIGRVTLTSALEIETGQNLAILGDRTGDGLADVTISAGGAGRHFDIAPAAALTLEDLRIVDGFAQGSNGSGSARDGSAATASISVEDGALTLRRVLFDDNSAFGGSGIGGAGGSGGSRGSDGRDGTIGDNVPGNGGRGGDGGNGTPGGDGADARLISASESASVVLEDVAFGDGNALSAGNGAAGGRGGNGGRGGDGGDAGIFTFTSLAGGTGGNGGTGGRGGNGGDGGDALLVDAAALDIRTAIADASSFDFGEGAGAGGGGNSGGGGTGGVSNTVPQVRASGGSSGGSRGRGQDGDAGIAGLAPAFSAADAETLVYLFPVDLSVEEGEDIAFAINRLGDTSGNFIVRYALEPEDGFDADDLGGGSLSGSVEFVNGGPDTRSVNLPTVSGDGMEGTEGFTVRLTAIEPTSVSDVQAVFGTSSADGTLSDAGGGGGGGETITGTPGPDEITETTDGDDMVFALGGEDFIAGSGGSDLLDGGAGIDTVVYALTRAQVSQTLVSPGSVRLTKAGEGMDELIDVERIDLVDGDFVYDVFGFDPGYVYRIYDASYARTPDEGGFRFWNEIFNADPDRKSLAEFFISSQEYQERYPEGTDEEYIENLYINALRRPADDEGRDFWLSEFQSGRQDRADMLMQFTDSTENVERNAENIDDGFWFV